MNIEPGTKNVGKRKEVKKSGNKKCKTNEDINANNLQKSGEMRQSKVTDTMKKKRRVYDRFNGTSKEELLTRVLPDHLKENLDILIIGINPGLFAAYKGHHYVGPGNHFWKCLYLSGLIPEKMTGMQDYLALNYEIGFTNMVARTTPGSKDLSSKEIKEGGLLLVEKIKTYKPKIAVFNGKCIYAIFSKEIFGQKKKDFKFGRQPNVIPGTETGIFVMPSTSARCAQFPRAEDKVHYFLQIKRWRNEINGVTTDDDVVETDYTFDLKEATKLAKINKVKEEKVDSNYDINSNSFTNSFPQTVPFPTSSSPLPISNKAIQPCSEDMLAAQNNFNKDMLSICSTSNIYSN